MNCGKKRNIDLEVRNDRCRVRISARLGVLGPAAAPALDEDVVLTRQGDRAQWNNEEEIWDVRLDAFAMD